MSEDERVDQLLAALPETAGQPVDDGALLAFRAGALDEASQDALARRIAADPGSRALLAAQVDGAAGEDRAWMAGMRVARGRRRRTLAVSGTVLAAAAALVFFALRPGARGPGYALDGPYGGLEDSRGETQAPSAVFGPRSTLVVFARPEGAPTPGTACAAFLRRPGGPARAVADGLAMGASGVCRLERRASGLFPAEGDWEVVLTLGPPGAHPDDSGARTLVAPVRYQKEPQ